MIVAGSWLPYTIQATSDAPPESEFSDYVLHRKNIQYIDMMKTELLNRFHKQGLRMYYLSTVEIVNWNACGIDFNKEGARELIPARI